MNRLQRSVCIPYFWRACLEELFFVFLLLLFFTFRFHSSLWGEAVFGPYQDNVFIHAPLFSAISKLAQSGQDPLWLPFFFCGFPIYDSPYFSLTYPFYFFHFLSYGGLVHALHALTQVTLLHLLLFAGNIYLLSRVSGANRTGAFFGSALSLIATNTIMYASWVTIAAPYAWMPLFMTGCVLLVKRPSSASAVALMIIGATMIALAGPSQAVIHAAVWALLYFGAATLYFGRRDRSYTSGLIWSVAMVGMAVSCLTAVALVPMYLSTSTLMRWVGNGIAITGYQRIPWRSFIVAQLTLKDAAGIAWPGISHAVVASPYIGPLAISGVGLALVRWKRGAPTTRFVVPAFSLLAVYFLWSSFGSNLGAAYLHYYVPLVNKIREPGRHLVMFVIMSCTLSSLGYRYAGQFWRQMTRTWGGRVVVGILLAFLGVLLLLPASANDGKERTIIVAVSVLAVGSVALLHPNKSKVLPVVTVAALLALNHCIATTAAIPAALSKTVRNTQIPMQVLSALAKSKSDLGRFRVDFDRTTGAPAWWAMEGVFYGLRSVRGWMQPVPANRIVIQSHLTESNVRSLFGVKYVVCAPSSKLQEKYKLSLSLGGYMVLENSHALPRFSLVPDVAGTLTEPKDIFTHTAGGSDLRRGTWLLRKDAAAVAASMAGFSTSAASFPELELQVEREQLNEVTLLTHADRPVILRFNEIFSPSWEARIGGRRLQTFAVDGYLTGAVIPAGAQTVSLAYRPILFEQLRLLQRIALVILVCWFAVSGFRRYRVYSQQISPLITA